MGHRIVLLGPPGAGKGTQGARLARTLGVEQVSTGDLLREAARRGTDLGRLAQRYMDDGRLVPDGVMLGLIREVLEKDPRRGFVLDGFPRTLAQAEGLDAMLASLGREIQRVAALDVDEAALVDRLARRRVCVSCGANEGPSPTGESAGSGGSEACPSCGGRLVQRVDDREDTVRRRLAVYREQTAPLVEYYARQGKLARVDGGRPVDAVFASLLQAVRNGSPAR